MKPRFFVEWKTLIPDALLLFEMESDYALFHDDALIAARVLGTGLVAVVYDGERIPTTMIRRESRDRLVELLESAGHPVMVCASSGNVGPRRRVA